MERLNPIRKAEQGKIGEPGGRLVRQVSPYLLWLGHAGEARDLRGLFDAGIAAVIDLALEEPPVAVPRELVYARFPLLDGPDNPAWLLRTAIETLAGLVRLRAPTLVACGAGLSRSPAIAAAAIALVEGRPPDDCLTSLVSAGCGDVSPGLWRDIRSVLLDRAT